MKKIFILFFVFLFSLFYYQYTNAHEGIIPPNPSINGCFEGAEVTKSDIISLGGYRYVCEIIVWKNGNYLRFTSDGIIDNILVSGLRTPIARVEYSDLWWVYIAPQKKIYLPNIQN